MQKITWTLEALNDFEDYIDWYLTNVSEVVASTFIAAVQVSLDKIRENNYIARMVDEVPEVREYIMHQYPFLISYWIKDPTEIIITAFLHQKMKK